MLCGIEPENIFTVVLHSLCGSSHTAGVVTAALCEACAADSRTDKLVLNVNSCGMKSAVVSRIVRSNRAKDNHKAVMLGRKNAERNLIAENERSYVKRRTRL